MTTPAAYTDDQLINMKMGHLNMIQGVITRMSSVSASAKTFTVTILAGLAAISTQADKMSLGVVASLATFVFLCTDVYYLMLEIRFRSYYDHVATRPLDQADRLAINQMKKPGDFKRAIGSRPTILFYCVVLLAANSFALYGSIYDKSARRLPQANPAGVERTHPSATPAAKRLREPVFNAAPAANGVGKRVPGSSANPGVERPAIGNTSQASTPPGDR